MITLSDVAKRANVSKMTVSRVINHPEQVSDDLRRMVFKAMEELDYRPNIAAKALANNRTQIIKFFILEEMNTVEPYYMNLLVGIAKELEKHQYSLQLVTKNSLLEIGGCDGYIVTGMRKGDIEWVKELDAPVVIFGENRYGYDFVDTDNYQGTALATRYAIERDYAHIVFVGLDIEEPFEFSREQGYYDTMLDHNHKPEIYHVENRSHLAETFIAYNWNTFEKDTVFICGSDRIGLGVERAILKEEGSLENYGVIGYDGVFLDQIASPKLTTIKQDVVGMGQDCARILLKKIKENGIAQGEFFHLPELVVRESTK